MVKNRYSRFAVSAAFKGADWALRLPVLRDYLVDRLLHRLDTSYGRCEENDQTLRHARWLGQHLQPFLHRLIEQRPAAARAVLRFIATWTRDMYRRTDAGRTGLAAPCTVVIEPTDRCNLNCPGCYAKSTKDGCDLPYDRLVQIVQQVIDMGVTLITLSGGEPFLRERADRALTRLAERFNDRGFLVYTNGTLIDKPTADRLAQVGNVFPAISVEGFEHETNARRGKGIYEQNRRVRRLLSERGVMCGFSATVTRANAEALCTDEFIDLRIAEGDLFGWFFLLQPIGRAPRADLMVDPEQRALLRQTVYRWRRQQRPIFLGDFWNDAHLVGGCIAGGRYYFHIYANGDISPCVFSPVACGNIFDIVAGRSPYTSLADFVQNHPIFKAYRREQQDLTDRSRPCLLIDHPEAFRRILQAGECRPAKNMPPDYVQGRIARAIDDTAARWKARAAQLPPLPAEVQAKAKVGALQAPQSRGAP